MGLTTTLQVTSFIETIIALLMRKMLIIKMVMRIAFVMNKIW